MKGRMLVTVRLLGTNLELHAGDEIIAERARNLPHTDDRTLWYVRPPNGEWRNGITTSEECSILVNYAEIELMAS